MALDAQHQTLINKEFDNIHGRLDDIEGRQDKIEEWKNDVEKDRTVQSIALDRMNLDLAGLKLGYDSLNSKADKILERVNYDKEKSLKSSISNWKKAFWVVVGVIIVLLLFLITGHIFYL